MEVRKFRLINSDGASYDFMLKTNFLHSPKGLGFNRKNTFLTLGDRFVRVNKDITQPGPSGTIAFIGNGNYDVYNKYHAFTQFIGKEPLKLKYSPNGTEYTMNVVVKKLEKTEINEQGYLDCDIEFAGLTPWYRVVTIDYYDGAGLVPSDSHPNANGLYPKNGLVPRNYTETTKTFMNNGTLNSPAKLRIYGPITNPIWEYGSLYYENFGQVNISVASNEVLIVDSTQIPFRICTSTVANEYDERRWRDVYDKSDFSCRRFIEFLPQTQSYFSVNNPSTAVNRPTRIILEVHEYYESV